MMTRRIRDTAYPKANAVAELASSSDNDAAMTTTATICAAARSR
jgi:hypothetical protein